jgi:transposase InsO family protein
MIAFIEENRDIGVEPICKHLPIAPSTFYDHMAKRANPDLLSDRAKRDKTPRPEIDRVWEQNYKVYGVRKVWHQMRREGFDVARCTVARLMNDMGLEGIIRGKKARTTIPDKALPCPLDKVNRKFRVSAPDMLWVSDFTYVATWQGFVYVRLSSMPSPAASSVGG